MDGTTDREIVLQRLAGLAQDLQADGYELRFEGLDEGRLRLAISAIGDACEDCLVSKPVLQRMYMAQLAGTGVREIELKYPKEQG
ncbi:MAG: hypothetical protein O3A51_13370 [Verrucomicrobia bacterium]|nr:hypothetical protein [Verrucomicrobiota bacterium]